MMGVPPLGTPGTGLAEAGRGLSSFARPKLDQVPVAQRCFPGARFPLACCRPQANEDLVRGIVDLANDALHLAGVDPGEALTRLLALCLAGDHRLDALDLPHECLIIHEVQPVELADEV